MQHHHFLAAAHNNPHSNLSLLLETIGPLSDLHLTLTRRWTKSFRVSDYLHHSRQCQTERGVFTV